MAPIGSSEVGGVEAYTFRLAEALREQGHQVLLYGGQPKEALSFPLISLRLFSYVETQAIPDFGTRFRRLIQRLHFGWKTRSDFLKESFDAILIFKPYDFVTAWFWRRCGLRTRVVASLHGAEFYIGDRFFAQSIDAMYAVSHSMAQSLQKRYGKPCEVIPNFLSGQGFIFLDRTFPPEEKMVLAVGRLVLMKGMAHLVRAFARVHSKIPAAKLMLIGEGPERPHLEQLIHQLHLDTVIKMPGVFSEQKVIEYHRKCWVYVQPSTGEESFSISVLEAFASGLSVVASDRVHIAKEFQKDMAVEIYPAEDESELEKCLIHALLQPWVENQKQGQRARAMVEKWFLADKVLPQIEKLCGK